MNSLSRVVSCCGPVGIALAVVSFLAFGPQPVARAAVYYVDANSPAVGDANPGTEARPWRTIGRAASSVQPGDTVFVKEGIYREMVTLNRSGTADNPITFAAYPGHEGKAVINAAEPLTHWTPCTGPGDCAGNPHWSHLYYADVAGFAVGHPDDGFTVRQVFQHGERLPRSRYPNVGWSYPTTVVNPQTIFADSALSRPRTYFSGAVCHIKTAMWQIDQIRISGSYNDTIILSKGPRYNISTQYGYYITSIVGEINEEGEWAYDTSRMRLYLWPRGDSPDGVEFSYREYCVRTNNQPSFNIVRGLALRHAYRYGIWLYLANNMTIEDNTIEYAFHTGIHLQSTYGPCNDNQILGNTIRYSGYRGINVDTEARRCNIEGNYVYATGVEHFGEDLLNGTSEGIYVVGAEARVYNNRIDRTGRVGLYLHGEARNRDVSYNYITNSGLALSDTGGIYTGGFCTGPEQDTIRHNIIKDSLGCQTMEKAHDRGMPVTIEAYAGNASGIYVDEEGNNRIIEHNTVIRSTRAGIYFHWASANVVRANTLYDNEGAQVWLSGKNQPQTILIDDALLDNILFATAGQQKTLYLGINYNDVHFGQSDGNFFYNPAGGTHVYVSRYLPQEGTTHENLTLDGWRALSGYDGRSLEFSHLDQFADLAIPRPVTSRIVCNPSLTTISIDVGTDSYCDVEGNKVYGQVILPPFESRILIAADYELPAPDFP